jgi:hypothetical protein
MSETGIPLSLDKSFFRIAACEETVAGLTCVRSRPSVAPAI